MTDKVGVKTIVHQNRFEDCELLLPFDCKANNFMKPILHTCQELRGQWAIVPGIK